MKRVERGGWRVKGEEKGHGSNADETQMKEIEELTAELRKLVRRGRFCFVMSGESFFQVGRRFYIRSIHNLLQ